MAKMIVYCPHCGEPFEIDVPVFDEAETCTVLKDKDIEFGKLEEGGEQKIGKN